MNLFAQICSGVNTGCDNFIKNYVLVMNLFAPVPYLVSVVTVWIKNYVLVMNLFARHLNGKPLVNVTREDIIKFLDTKKKTLQEDPDEKWKTTRNGYRNRIDGFYLWLVNRYEKTDPDDWEMPAIVRTIKPKKTKRLSPYTPYSLT